MPDNVRLDMAIKYSLDKYNESLLEVRKILDLLLIPAEPNAIVNRNF